MHHDLPSADPSLDRFADLPNGQRICFRCYGPSDRPAIVLIAGLGLQLVSWPMALIEGLVAEGLQVITLDNRDMGRSSYTALPPPARWRMLCRLVPASHYQIKDMAEDVALLLEQLQIDSAHVLGMSMGGMIAQTLAARHPQQVRSLTSIFSTTGNPRVGQPAGSTLLRMLLGRPAYALQAAQDKYVRFMRHIGNRKVPGIETMWRNYIAQAWQRVQPQQAIDGYEHQVAAIIASGDRSADLYAIDTPTLVLHGDRDLIVHPSGGGATARAISGAQLQTVVGMRHQLDAHITPVLLPLVIAHLRAADRQPARPAAHG